MHPYAPQGTVALCPCGKLLELYLPSHSVMGYSELVSSPCWEVLRLASACAFVTIGDTGWKEHVPTTSPSGTVWPLRVWLNPAKKFVSVTGLVNLREGTRQPLVWGDLARDGVLESVPSSA